MRYSTTALVAALAGFVSAQNFNYSTSGPLTIDVTQIKPDLRQAWCRGQYNSCPYICGDGRAAPNTCDPNTLQWQCVCTNGNQPNFTDYDQTMPSFICAQWRTNCVLNHPNDRPGQAGCESVVCGKKNASLALTVGSASATQAANTATITSSPASTTAAATTAAATTTSRGVAAAMQFAEYYGTGALAAGAVAVFGLAL